MPRALRADPPLREGDRGAKRYRDHGKSLKVNGDPTISPVALDTPHGLRDRVGHRLELAWGHLGEDRKR